MRALILGAGGMLGHSLQRTLSDRGVDFVGLRRADCDVTSRDAVKAAIDSVKPTHVFNCTAYTAVDLAETNEALAAVLNATAPGNIGEIAAERGAVVVHFSTDFVFDGKGSRPYREVDAAAPVGVYARTKYEGEGLVAKASDRNLVLRTAWLFGRPGKNFVRTMVTRGRAGQPLRVVADQTGSPTLTDDLAAAALALATRGGCGLFHVAGDDSCTWFDFAKAALEAFGVKADVGAISTADWRAQYPATAPRPAYSVLDCSKAAGYGVRCRGYRETLAQYASDVDRLGFDG